MKDGGSAFPVIGYTMNASGALDGQYLVNPGMSLRNYFAAAALTGLLAESRTSELKDAQIARAAYSAADAMLAEQEKKGAQ